MALVYTGITSDTMRATDRRIQRSSCVGPWEFERAQAALAKSLAAGEEGK